VYGGQESVRSYICVYGGQESVRSYICVHGVSILTLSTILLLNFGTDLTVWYYYFFHFK